MNTQNVQAIIDEWRRGAGGVIPAHAGEIEQAVGQFEQPGIPAGGVEVIDGADCGRAKAQIVRLIIAVDVQLRRRGFHGQRGGRRLTAFLARLRDARQSVRHGLRHLGMLCRLAHERAIRLRQSVGGALLWPAMRLPQKASRRLVERAEHAGGGL